MAMKAKAQSSPARTLRELMAAANADGAESPKPRALEIDLTPAGSYLKENEVMKGTNVTGTMIATDALRVRTTAIAMSADAS